MGDERTTSRAILHGSSHPELARALVAELGVPETRFRVEHFPDGEVHVEIEEPLRGRDVVVVQAMSRPVGENLLELALLEDASHRAGAASTTAIVPYFGYARQDRRKREGQPLGMRVVAELLSRRFARVIGVDVHSDAVEGALEVPLEHLSAEPLLAAALRRHVTRDAVVVAPDLGAAKTARRFGEWLDLPVAIVHKTRVSGSDVAVQGIVGEVRGLRPLLVDDMIATAGTLEAAVHAVIAAGATPEPWIAATHGLLVGPALARLSPLGVARLFCTDSVAQPATLPFPHEVVPLAPLLAEALRRIDAGRSLDDLRAVR